MIALGRSGIAVRHLHQRPRSLESTFLQLTGAATDTGSIDAAVAVASTPRRPDRHVMRAKAVLAVSRAEYVKLAARVKAPGVLAACAVAPFVFVSAMRMQSSLPKTPSSAVR